jgi:hypothetical protein
VGHRGDISSSVEEDSNEVIVAAASRNDKGSMLARSINLHQISESQYVPDYGGIDIWIGWEKQQQMQQQQQQQMRRRRFDRDDSCTSSSCCVKNTSSTSRTYREILDVDDYHHIYDDNRHDVDPHDEANSIGTSWSTDNEEEEDHDDDDDDDDKEEEDQNRPPFDSLYDFEYDFDHHYSYESYREEFLDEIDYKSLHRKYNSKDDSYVNDDDEYEEEEDEDDDGDCRPPDWVYSTYSTCNILHETVIERPPLSLGLLEVKTDDDEHERSINDYLYQQTHEVKYLSHGEFRDAWRFRRRQTRMLRHHNHGMSQQQQQQQQIHHEEGVRIDGNVCSTSPSQQSGITPASSPSLSSFSSSPHTGTDADCDAMVIDSAPSTTPSSKVTHSYDIHEYYDDEFVMKRFRLNRYFDERDLYESRREALLMERYSHSSHVVDIYAMCGTSIVVEAMMSDIHTIIIRGEGWVSQSDLDAEYKKRREERLEQRSIFGGGSGSQDASDDECDDLDKYISQNNLTISEKLQIALSMAESLVLMHDNDDDGSIIVNDDVHIEQWLVSYDGSVKLNDLQNSEVMEWDPYTGRQCLPHLMYGGTYRAPEEYTGDYQDEKKDVYAFGQNIYCLLTGLFPYYDEDSRDVDEEEIIAMIINGTRPYIDERLRTPQRSSYIESQLVNIMEQCWAYSRHDRPPMRELVSKLKHVKSVASKIGELQPSDWIDVFL